MTRDQCQRLGQKLLEAYVELQLLHTQMGHEEQRRSAASESRGHLVAFPRSQSGRCGSIPNASQNHGPAMSGPTLVTNAPGNALYDIQLELEAESAQLDALADLLGLLGEKTGMEGGAWYAIMYAVRDAKSGDRVADQLAEAA